jgi:hypothetical protein
VFPEPYYVPGSEKITAEINNLTVNLMQNITLFRLGIIIKNETKMSGIQNSDSG